jgi:glycerol-3-phosphate O-acyltransferase/dihydroxyacetone phosphate acyltransferase
LLVNGINTKFTSEIKERATLVLPKSAGYASAEVAEIVSNTELK